MTVSLARREAVAILTLDRQSVLNALSFAMLRDIGDLIDQVAQSDARALIVTGAGPKAFCAGADIKELRGRSLLDQKRGSELGQGVFAKLDALPLPSIAVINGHAFGGGFEFAMACTFRLATRQAKMGLPEIKLGLIPGYGGTQRLPRLVGEARALEIIMTGRTVEAEEAFRIGLVNRLIDGEPLEAGMAFARELAVFSLRTLEFARAAVCRAADLPLSEGLKAEAELSTLAYRTVDAEEGMAAFVEKRKPDFRDA
jgi:enoyl-CoA hydratase